MKRSASNNTDVKTFNRILVRNIIRKLGPIARYELANETGLTPPTITVIINQLIRDGIVVETGYGESSGGRRPVMLELNPKIAYIFAVRLQRGEAVTALFDIGGTILGHHKQALDTSMADEVVEAVGASFDKLLEKNSDVKKENILYCGAASPGLINKHRGLVKHSSNLKWDNVPLGAMLSKRLYGIPVYVENISNAAAFAEKEYGKGQGYQNFVYLNLSVGIGAGVIIDGEIYGGSKGFAGEIGKMPLFFRNSSGVLEKSNRLETVCGIRAILGQLKNEVPDDVFAKYGLNKAKLNEADFLRLSLLEEKRVQAILHEAGKWVGVTVANLVSIFNPELVILGGTLSELGQWFVDEVIDEMRKYVLKEFLDTVEVVGSNMTEDPPLMGAYALALDMLFSVKKWDL